MAKARAYGIDFSDEERDAAIYTLHKVLSTILKLMAPITPFITEYLWKTLYSKDSIHNEQLPKSENIQSVNEYTSHIIEFNSKVWNQKKEKNLSLKDSIKINVPENLQQLKKDLVAMHNLKSD
jgi:valyl-tRNA synthetase